MNDKLLGLLGLAARARKITTGEELVIKDIRSGKAKLVLIASDASNNSRKKIEDKCKYYNVEYHFFGDRFTLGHAIGKETRIAIAIIDDGFAKKVSSLLNEN